MDELHLLGVHEDGDRLLLATADGQRRFSLPLDDALRAAVRWERTTRPGAPDGEPMRPRDVQAMIRAGATAEEAAERANWSVDKVRRYEGPILAERQYMATEAGRAHVRARSGMMVTLAERVAERLLTRGVDAETATWDAWRDEGGQWTVEVRFAAGGRRRTAAWHFGRASMTVQARDDEARWLSEDEAEPEPTEPHVVPTHPRVYDVDADSGVRPTLHSGTSDEVSLMTAMREHSGVRTRKRGARRSPAASPTAIPALVEAVEEAAPLEELHYDPQTMPPPPAAHAHPDPDGVDGIPEPITQDAVPTPDGDVADGTLSLAPIDAPVAAPAQAPAAVASQDREVTNEQADDATDAATAESERPSVARDAVEEPELPLARDIGSEPEHAPAPAPQPEPAPKPRPASRSKARRGPKASPASAPAPDAAGETMPEEALEASPKPAQGRNATGQRSQTTRTSRSGRKGRSSVPAWDDIVFGAKPGDDA